MGHATRIHNPPVAVDVDYPEPGEYESRQEPAFQEKGRGEGKRGEERIDLTLSNWGKINVE